MKLACATTTGTDNLAYARHIPFLQIKDSRLFITPHFAWASVEARTRLMKIVLEQIKEFFNHK